MYLCMYVCMYVCMYACVKIDNDSWIQSTCVNLNPVDLLIHSFIHIEHLYRASSRKLLRGA